MIETIDIPRGVDFTLPMTYEDDTGAAINIVGAAIVLEVRDRAVGESGSTALIRLTSAAGQVVITNGAAGQFAAHFPAAATATATWRTATAQVAITFTGQSAPDVLPAFRLALEPTYVAP